MSSARTALLTALLAVSVGSATAFAARGSAASVAAGSKVARPALRTASAMSMHTPTEMISTLISAAADVADDFDVNALPSPVQNLLLSPIVLAVPIGIGMTVAGAIIAFLLWSMGAF
jgi:hypothetical protein